MKYNCKIVYVIFSILVSCQAKNSKTEALEVRDITKNISIDQKSALNFLAVTMDPYEEFGYIYESSNMYSKVYFYFDINKSSQQFVIKRETYFDYSMPKKVLTSNELNSIEYIIYPLDLLSSDNITIGQGELDNRPIENHYSVNINTLYKKLIKRKIKWYSTSTEMGQNRLERIDEVEASSVQISFNNYQKANLFATKFKILSTIKSK